MVHRTALTQAEKEYISQRKAEGASLHEISMALQCSYATARKWWRIQRKKKVMRPRGRPTKGVLSTYPEALRAEAIQLKKRHPHWGPASIKLELKQEAAFSDVKLPSDARLSVLFQQVCSEAVQPRNAQPVRREKHTKVKYPHQRWQIDGKEGIPIGKDFVTILAFRELFCGLMIGAKAFVTTSEKRWHHLALAEVQSAFREVFTKWGLPLEIQTDHEAVYWNINDPTFPSLFTLWLIGLGIQHLPSRPYRPTDQGAVERNHRTLGDFAWKDEQFSQVEELQSALDHHMHRYNTDFPSEAAHCHQQAPLATFPERQSTGRPYHPAHEWEFFKMQLVDAYLAQFIWKRLVTSSGIVYLAHQKYNLLRSRAGQKVSARYIPGVRSFRFQDETGNVLSELPAQGLNKEDILGFIPANLALPVGYQFSLPLVGV